VIDRRLDIKDAYRKGVMMTFAPAGVFEMDDGENWEYATRASDGIALRLNCSVTGIDARGVSLAGGGRVDAKVIVIGIGARPRTGCLADSGLSLSPDGAIVVDSQLCAQPSGVYGAGDVVQWPSELFGDQLRVEHWEHAAASGRAAALNLLGAAEPYDPVPHFWSDQLGHRLQYVGHHAREDQLVFRGQPHTGESWTALWLGTD
jgi:3-phenylpropionate/trans-cinnamate dioxygenase ferredoxin reductase subunit